MPLSSTSQGLYRLPQMSFKTEPRPALCLQLRVFIPQLRRDEVVMNRLSLMTKTDSSALETLRACCRRFDFAVCKLQPPYFARGKSQGMPLLAWCSKAQFCLEMIPQLSGTGLAKSRKPRRNLGGENKGRSRAPVCAAVLFVVIQSSPPPLRLLQLGSEEFKAWRSVQNDSEHYNPGSA